MEVNEIIFSIVLFGVGLFGSTYKNVTPFARLFFVTIVLSIIILIEKGTLLSLVFFFSFLPSIFLQRKVKKNIAKYPSSKVLEKILAYMGIVPLFGLAFIFRNKLSQVIKTWDFPIELIPLLEIGLIVLTVYWSLEWTKKLKRTLE